MPPPRHVLGISACYLGTQPDYHILRPVLPQSPGKGETKIEDSLLWDCYVIATGSGSCYLVGTFETAP